MHSTQNDHLFISVESERDITAKLSVTSVDKEIQSNR